ncbi:glycoside hydrolase family 43 protein [Humibacillus xanthopallidus]|uniref:glycoside hydrolase family 43 protein n=1 Tax=Humibacillus xanthopallidus TaxID=412689 RepID=UPI0021AB2E0B|nr:glycoside hydrolase family 43 protein [Humibacillus xanthopallidus]
MTAALGAVLLAGCGRATETTSGGSVTTPASTWASRPAAAATNPVWPSNFPDPQILPDGDGWVAIATNGNGMNVQTLVSDDLTSWTQGSDAMPELASWTTPGKVWAPEVHRFGDRWVMYYTTTAPDPSIQCIGLAVADDPKGPYRDTGSTPLVCEQDQGGSIDASPFVAADGTAYLYWKNDGNAVGVDTWISVQRLSADGMRLEGEAKRLIRQDLPWEGHLVEAPFVWERDGVFHLFYSANDYGSDRYAVGHATASSPTGPFTKDAEPVLTSTDVAAGPGHCALFDKDGRVLMVYHAWAPDAVGSEVPGRTMWLSEVTFDGTQVSVTPAQSRLPAGL